MELRYLTLVTFGCLFLFLIRFYWNLKKKVLGFPFVNFVSSLIYDQLMGKLPKGVSINSVVFQRIIQAAKQHNKEGLFMTFLSRPVLVIYGEEAIKVFANEKAAVDKPPEYKIVQEVMGDGLGLRSGSRWKTHRKLMNPVFHMDMVKENVHLFNEHGLALIRDMEKLVTEPYVDLSRCLKRHYLSVLYGFLFGLKENKELINRIGECVDLGSSLSVKRISSPWLYPRFLLPLFPTGRLFNQIVKEADDITDSIIYEMKTHVFSSKSQNSEYSSNNIRKSLAYILLNQHLNDLTFTLQDVRDEVKSTLIAGYDTVSWATVWCLYLLGLHPDIQEKAYEEVMSKTSDFITYEESRNLEYLNAIILETLRLYPILPLLGRNLTKDVQFGKYKVSKGTTIIFFSYMSNRNSDLYPDPETFRPERFLSGNSQKSCTFIPFFEGNRSCIGKNFALLEMKIFLGHILRNFQIISLDKRDDVRLTWEILLTPDKPLRMKVIQRHN